MIELTATKFMEEIRSNRGNYNIQSVDGGAVYFSLGDCTVTISNEDGIDGEITFFKPRTGMEVAIDFAVIEVINKKEDTYFLEFNNGLADVEIMPVKSA